MRCRGKVWFLCFCVGGREGWKARGREGAAREWIEILPFSAYPHQHSHARAIKTHTRTHIKRLRKFFIKEMTRGQHLENRCLGQLGQVRYGSLRGKAPRNRLSLDTLMLFAFWGSGIGGGGGGGEAVSILYYKSGCTLTLVSPLFFLLHSLPPSLTATPRASTCDRPRFPSPPPQPTLRRTSYLPRRGRKAHHSPSPLRQHS